VCDGANRRREYRQHSNTWWVGLRDVEKEKYEDAGENFDEDKHRFGFGFHPTSRPSMLTKKQIHRNVTLDENHIPTIRYYPTLVMIVPARVSIVIFVPTVIVFKPATISIPVTSKELLPIVMRRDPVGARIRRTGPIALVPPVMSPEGIPVSIDPDIVWTGTYRPHVNYARRRRRTNSNAEGHLRVRCRCPGRKHRQKHHCRNEVPGTLQFSLTTFAKLICQITPPTK
jgi:hypothetical protein